MNFSTLPKIQGGFVPRDTSLSEEADRATRVQPILDRYPGMFSIPKKPKLEDGDASGWRIVHFGGPHEVVAAGMKNRLDLAAYTRQVRRG